MKKLEVKELYFSFLEETVEDYADTLLFAPNGSDFPDSIIIEEHSIMLANMVITNILAILGGLGEPVFAVGSLFMLVENPNKVFPIEQNIYDFDEIGYLKAIDKFEDLNKVNVFNHEESFNKFIKKHKKSKNLYAN